MSNKSLKNDSNCSPEHPKTRRCLGTLPSVPSHVLESEPNLDQSPNGSICRLLGDVSKVGSFSPIDLMPL